MLPFSCQHREQYISKMNYKITVQYESHEEGFIFPDYNYKDGPFSQLYFWDLEVTFGYVIVCDHVIQISSRMMNFQDIQYRIFPTVKSKNLFWKRLLHNIKFFSNG
jgi:hypothetical protein